MSTIRRFLVALAVLTAPLAAHAQNSIAYRLGPGGQMTCSSGVPTHISTRGTVWCNSSDSNKLHYTDPSGADIALGAGGGGTGTLATTYAAGTAQTSSTFSLDSTRLGLRVFDNATPISGDLFRIANSANSTTYFAINATGQQVLRSGAPTGGNATIIDTAATYSTGNLLRVANNGSLRWSLDFAGNPSFVGAAWALAANTVLTGASSATNTNGLTLRSNVADGSTSIGLLIDNTAALSAGQSVVIATGGAAYAGIYNNGTFATFQGDTANTRFIGAAGAGIADQSGTFYIYVGGTAEVQVDSSGVTAFNPTLTLGKSASPWPVAYSKHFSGSGSGVTAPTKAAGACLGGTQTVTLDANASDAAGTITLTSTATGTASSTCATVTFNVAYGTAPHCQISPANAAAAALTGAASLFAPASGVSTTAFTVVEGSTALVAGTYVVNYDCTQ